MEDAVEWSISAKKAVQVLLVKQRHIRTVDFALVLVFVEKVRCRGNASESQSASRPLPPTKRTERGVTSPAPGLGWRASAAGSRAEPCPGESENCPEPTHTTRSWSLLSLLSEFLGGYMLV